MATIPGTSANETLTGDIDGPNTDDTFLLQTGGSGDNNGLDQYFGGGGYNRILGGWSYDVLHVLNNLANLNGSIDEIDGGDGQPGYNTILATTGNDTLDFSGIVVKSFVIDGGKGNDTITGTSGNDHIRGGEGNDTLNGRDGDDTFYLITGGNTNGLDQYDGGSGHNRIVGGWSYDTLNVTNHLANLVGIQELDGGDGTLGRNVIRAKPGVHDTLDFTGYTIKNFDIDGDNGNDTITGSADDNRIIGNTGNDKLDGAEGSDTYLVGSGHGADTFTDSGSAGDTDRVVATATGVSIGVSAISGIELISAGGKAGVTVVGTADHQILDFSNVAFDGIGVVDALGGNDVITTSDQTAGQAYRGGAGNDTFNLGGADTVLRVSAADDGGYDTFSGNTAGATHRILAENAGTQIGIGKDYANDVDIIDGNGKANVTINGSSGHHNAWDLSATKLLGIKEVATAGGNDEIRTSSDSDAAGGQAYRGGTGHDDFIFGTQDTRLLVSSADNGGYDSFSGNTAGALHTIVVEDAGTEVGIGKTYGGTDSVDTIDATGKANASIVGSSGSHDNWDLSRTEFKNVSMVAMGGGNDKVQTALASGNHITYDGGAYSGDKLTISLTAAQAGNVTLMTQIAALTPGSGLNGNLNAGGVDMTVQNWESFAVAVELGGSFEPLNILFGTSNHQNGVNTPVLSVPAAKVNESWAIFGLGGDDIIIGGNKADFIDGGGGTDTMNGGGGDDTFFATAPTSQYGDKYDGGSGFDTIVTGDGSDIVISSLTGIEEIGANGFGDVDLVGSNSVHVTLDLAGVKLTGIAEVYGGTANNTIWTSNLTADQAYRGGKGNDTFHFGDEDTILLYSSADNGGYDGFAGNTAGATHRIVAEDDGTQIGIATNYGGSNSVDIIDGDGNANVSILGADSAHNTWNFSGTEFADISLVATGGGNDVVQTALMTAGGPITYDGGAYAGDHLTISLTAAQAGNAAVQADLAALTAGSGANGSVDEGGLNLTATGWEIIDWVVV
ncbi:MAG TPA: hypothetical protein PKA33_02865 [Amaricoccus sp.]|uniref:beta strand repeat-containing protein n=1 Tax=Amaricoccus sp. TaxID=1872485 RepID=UPI002CC137D1|nr:hypothetical protein [Amaricoccus sp.]HMQ92381.1 hypothetical protein [Amaricoccus sp.]HMR51403.1 hypothetical protein [Amaricoccus sp.]HMR61273.1 hypothetical protein [Amaricoccus sp.]HMT98292.1 hypothetical protein [Amaricoccus sp.]